MAWEPKDPWGKKGDSMDDVLRQARDQIRQFIPVKGVGTIILIVLVVIVAFNSFFLVGPREKGVVKRFGDVVGIYGPGPHFKIPFVDTVLKPEVEKVHRVSIGFRPDRRGGHQMLPREARMLTGDENIVSVEFIVQYRIDDARLFLFNVAEIQDTIRKSAEASMREIIGKTRIDEVLTTGKAKIQEDTMSLLQTILDKYQTGVSIQAVQLQDVDPPTQVAGAFKDVASAKEDREKLINQAETYRNDILPKAKGEAAQEVNQAKGFAQARVNRAKGEANRFLATLKEYKRAKDVISKRIYIETLEEILPNVETIIVDKNIGERILPYLPLDRASRSNKAARANQK